MFHGALSCYVAHLLAVVALRLLVTLWAITSQVITLSTPGEWTKAIKVAKINYISP